VRSEIVNKIQAMVDLETKGWDTKNPELFLSMIHPDMVWPFPPTADTHNPIDWVFVMGRFDRERWRNDWQGLFDTHDLVHNRRVTVKIEISKEEDAAFAVVDIDTLWRHRDTEEDFHWKGRGARSTQNCRPASGSSITRLAPSIFHRGVVRRCWPRTETSAHGRVPTIYRPRPAGAIPQP
jgi:hypothetical protein